LAWRAWRPGWHAFEAQAWIGISIGIPVYRPCGPYPYYYGPYGYGPYYRPYVYVAPAPVYVAPPPPVVYQQAPVVVPQPQPIPVVSQPLPPPSPPRASYSDTPAQSWNASTQADAERYLQQLASTDERSRSDAAIELGRLRADRAVDGLISMLNADKSPQARETAARALGLIAAPRSLNALQQAAQADNDREVRHSAQFAAEVIRANLRRD
jgi:hypothetical protein